MDQPSVPLYNSGSSGDGDEVDIEERVIKINLDDVEDDEND